jgi:hypothetical protein
MKRKREASPFPGRQKYPEYQGHGTFELYIRILKTGI